MGINGMRVNKKMMVGKRARRNEKDTELALATSDPCLSPPIKKIVVSYSEMPSNPGRIILLPSLAAIILTLSSEFLR
jgi:hypothetical protein